MITQSGVVAVCALLIVSAMPMDLAAKQQAHGGVSARSPADSEISDHHEHLAEKTARLGPAASAKETSRVRLDTGSAQTVQGNDNLIETRQPYRPSDSETDQASSVQSSEQSDANEEQTRVGDNARTAESVTITRRNGPRHVVDSNSRVVNSMVAAGSSTQTGEIVESEVIGRNNAERTSSAVEHKKSQAVAATSKVEARDVNQGTSGCGSTVTSNTGSIQSPNYPADYTNNLNCTWNINLADTSKQVELKFISMDIEKKNETCPDWLEIVGGWDRENGTVCGNDTQSVSHSYSSHKITVRFVTNGNVTRKGFRINYKAIKKCSEQFAASSGIIKSPNYPEKYPDRVLCTWTINLPDASKKVNLTFDKFEMEDSKSCQYDWLAIWLDHGNDYVRYFCGGVKPSMKIFNGSNITLRFFSDNIIGKDGFQITYSAASIVCGGDIYTEIGLLSSPNYPQSYPTSITCKWIITLPNEESYVHLIFEQFDVEWDGETYCKDWLALGGVHDENYTYLCGKDALYGAHRTYIMWIVFNSNSVQTNQIGFRARYESATVPCGGMISASSGFIQSPNFPKNYSNDDSCQWVIVLPDPRQYVNLSFQSFDTEPDEEFCFDFLGIASASDEKYLYYCGLGIPGTRTYNSHKIYVWFKSSSQNTRKGFRAKFQAVDCPGELLSEYGTIEFPMYPFTYRRNMNCEWKVKHPNETNVANGTNIRVSFEMMDIDWSTNCTNDHVGMKGSEETAWQYFCGYRAADVVDFVGKELSIKFESDGGASGKGFRAQYQFILP